MFQHKRVVVIIRNHSLGHSSRGRRTERGEINETLGSMEKPISSISQDIDLRKGEIESIPVSQFGVKVFMISGKELPFKLPILKSLEFKTNTI